jgi:hypothetical protein
MIFETICAGFDRAKEMKWRVSVCIAICAVHAIVRIKLCASAVKGLSIRCMFQPPVRRRLNLGIFSCIVSLFVVILARSWTGDVIGFDI